MNDAISIYEQIVSEGLAKIIVPKLDQYKRPDGVVEPAWMPVFYNPEAVVSRDFTSIVLRSIYQGEEFSFIDALAGTGIRGIRISLETGGSGILNDADPRAHYYITRNIEFNKLAGKLQAFHHDANTLLDNLARSGLILDYVDIDPYGSPIPYVDSSIRAIGRSGVIAYTATDTGPLTCTYRNKALSRYWSNCIKVDFEKEFASRLLISNVVMRASALEYEARPLLTLVHRHYIRVFFSLYRSSLRAYKLMENCIGYIWYCEKTLERGFTRFLDEVRDTRCTDGSHPAVLGKTWICSLYDDSLVKRLPTIVKEMTWISRDSMKILDLIISEHEIDSTYYRLDKLCSAIGVNMPSMDKLISTMRERGFKCSRTHMDPRGIKVSASHDELVKIIKDIQSS